MARARSWWAVLVGVAVTLTGLAPVGGQTAVAVEPPPVGASLAPVTSGFGDVPPSAPFYAEITWLAGESITTGFPDGTFHPAASVERQAMAAFLYRYAGRPAYTPPASARFSDVPTSSPFYTEISWLAAQGITTGYPDGGFHPLEAVSRQAMAAFLYRFAGSPAFTPPTAARFGDVPPGAPFRAEVEWLASTGVTTGYPDGTFHPGANVERQAMAAFLYRAQSLKPRGTPPLTAPMPTIAGTVAVGSVLTAQPGTWAPSGVALTYQWAAAGTAIAGATGPSYTVTANDVGKALTVTVTGTKAGYASTSRTSSPTSTVPAPAPQGVVAVRTQRMSDATLSSTQAGWYEAGARLNLVCYRTGQSVQGYFSPYVGNGGWDSMWYQVSDGYFVADIDLETGTLEPVVDRCPGSSPTSTTNATVMATTQRMSAASLTSTQSGTYAAGARLTLTCYTHGQAVQGYFSPYLPGGGWDDLWYKVSDGYYVADVDIETGSTNPVTPACSPPPSPPSGNAVLTRAQSWIDARVPYNQGSSYTNQYGTYRQDCSGFVSMALGLPTSLVTGTLPQVLHRIGKEDLQPGDIMLNTASGNYGHAAIFVRWADAAHTKYVSWEENGMAGYTIEQTVPYPYWPSWAGSSAYFPYRRS